MKSIAEHKQDIARLVEFLEQFRKKHHLGKNKQLAYFLKIGKEFVRCHQTNNAIYKKWNAIQDYYMQIRGLSDSPEWKEVFNGLEG